MSMKTNINYKKRILIIVILIAFLLGLIIAVFVNNFIHKDRNQNIDITFTNPHQVVIFWTTPTKTLGYVKYGKDKRNLTQKSEQTSSVSGNIHAVVIDEIPIEGVYISLHNESDSWFLFPEVFLVEFNPETFIE